MACSKFDVLLLLYALVEGNVSYLRFCTILERILVPGQPLISQDRLASFYLFLGPPCLQPRWLGRSDYPVGNIYHPGLVSSVQWRPRSLVTNTFFPFRLSSIKIWFDIIHVKAQLSNLWWMPNSVRIGFGPAMKTGSSRRFKRNPTTYMWVSSWLPFTVD